jgi:hypothetical protein
MGPAGGETTVLIPGTDVQIKARYGVVPLKLTVPSHHPFSFQPNENHPQGNQRSYETQEAQSRVMDQTRRFEHRYVITDNPDNVNGPPVVARNPADAGKPLDEQELYGLGGSSRLMTLHRVAELYPEKYAAWCGT